MPRRSSATLKFLLYSVAGWGGSAVLTAAALAADTLALPAGWTAPGVGRSKCFLQVSTATNKPDQQVVPSLLQDAALGIFLHLPVLVFMLLNACFFLMTTLSLHRSNLTTHVARRARQGRASSGPSAVQAGRINQDTLDQLVRLLSICKLGGGVGTR